MTFLLCGSTLTASAAGGDSEGSELDNIKELLNAISYNEYMKEYTSKGELAKEEDGDDSTNPNYFDLVPNAGSEIVLDGLDGVYVNNLGDVLEYDPAEALKLVQLFMKTWPKDEASREFKARIPELREKAKEKAKADREKSKDR